MKEAAVALEIPVYQPVDFNESGAYEELRELGVDLIVVAAYGIILPQRVLDIPRLGCINIHASLLPRWRGAAPVQRAILAGDEESGVTIMQMDKGLDTGDILSAASVAIGSDWTAEKLHDELKDLGAKLLIKTLFDLDGGQVKRTKQDDTQSTYAARLTKTEALIDWNQSADQLDREIRAYNPWPVSHSSLKGEPVRFWKAAVVNSSPAASDALPGQITEHSKKGVFVQCGQSILRVEELQLAGKKRCTAHQLLNGRNLKGCCFGS